jgi:hypothetical protein
MVAAMGQQLPQHHPAGIDGSLFHDVEPSVCLSPDQPSQKADQEESEQHICVGTCRGVDHLYVARVAGVPPPGPAPGYPAHLAASHQLHPHLAPPGRENDVGLRAVLQTAPPALHHQGVHLLIPGHPPLRVKLQEDEHLASGVLSDHRSAFREREHVFLLHRWHSGSGDCCSYSSALRLEVDHLNRRAEVHFYVCGGDECHNLRGGSAIAILCDMISIYQSYIFQPVT